MLHTFLTAIGIIIGIPIILLLAMMVRGVHKKEEGVPRGRRIDLRSGDGNFTGGVGPKTHSSLVSASYNPRPNTRTKSKPKVKTTKTNKKPTVVKRSEDPYWKRRGWKKNNGNLVGYYRTKYGSFKGTIEDYRGKPEVYIYSPPVELKNHLHYQCFFHRGNGKYFVHFSRGVPNPSIAIETVEQILRESFQNS